MVLAIVVFGVGLFCGYMLGHYEGLRCPCPKIPKPTSPAESGEE